MMSYGEPSVGSHLRPPIRRRRVVLDAYAVWINPTASVMSAAAMSSAPVRVRLVQPRAHRTAVLNGWGLRGGEQHRYTPGAEHLTVGHISTSATPAEMSSSPPTPMRGRNCKPMNPTHVTPFPRPVSLLQTRKSSVRGNVSTSHILGDAKK